MFVNDKIIYLQLQKTGCTHIARLLSTHLGGANEHKHGRLDRDPAGRVVIGSVRNPWDWYVSLWAYGCMGKGAIQTRLTNTPMQAAARTMRNAVAHPAQWAGVPGKVSREISGNKSAFWRRVYADANDYGAFRDWLHASHDPATQNTVFEDPRPMQLHGEVGLYTARLVYLYSDAAQWDRHAAAIQTQPDIIAFYDHHKVVHRMIRTENIATDLADVMADVGRAEISASVLEAEGKTNSSKRTRFEAYYDPASVDLVARRDGFVTKTFGYAAPVIGSD